MSFFGGSSTTKTTQTQQGTAEQDQQIKDYFNLLQGFTAGGPQQYFPGETVAQLTPEQLQAQQMMLQFAQGGAQDLYGQMQGAGQAAGNMIGMAGQDPSTSPGFQQMVDYLTTRSNQNFSENLLPQIRGGSIANNMYGSSRGADAGALAGARTQEGLSGTIGQMLMEAYARNNQNALSAMGMMPGITGATQQAGLLPAQLVGAVGEQNQGMDQALINAAIDRWNFEQNAPATHLAQTQALQGRVGDYGGTTQTTQKTKTPFSLNQAIGSIGTIGSLFTPMGSPAGINPSFASGQIPGVPTPSQMAGFGAYNANTPGSTWNINQLFPGLGGGGG
jgi:hypothetical protein